MKKKLQKKLLANKNPRKRYTIEFAKNVNFEALNQDPVLSKHLEWLTFRNSSGQAYVSPKLSDTKLIEQLSVVLSLEPDEITLREMTDGLSDFIPLG